MASSCRDNKTLITESHYQSKLLKTISKTSCRRDLLIIGGRNFLKTSNNDEYSDCPIKTTQNNTISRVLPTLKFYVAIIMASDGFPKIILLNT
jgi:hypothetical protein